MDKNNVVIKVRYDELINTFTVPNDEREEHFFNQFLDEIRIIRLEPIKDKWLQLLLDCFSFPITSIDQFLGYSYLIRFKEIGNETELFYYASLRNNLRELISLLENSFLLLKISGNSSNNESISGSILEGLDFINNDGICTKYIRPFSKSDLLDLDIILNNKIDSIKINQIKTVNFSREVQSKIFLCIKKHFNDIEHNSLKEALKGYELSDQISFNGNLNQFVDLFSRLKSIGMIKDDTIDIERWVVMNFKIQKGKNLKNINNSTVHEYLTKEGKGTVNNDKEICKDILK